MNNTQTLNIKKCTSVILAFLLISLNSLTAKEEKKTDGFYDNDVSQYTGETSKSSSSSSTKIIESSSNSTSDGSKSPIEIQYYSNKKPLDRINIEGLDSKLKSITETIKSSSSVGTSISSSSSEISSTSSSSSVGSSNSSVSSETTITRDVNRTVSSGDSGTYSNKSPIPSLKLPDLNISSTGNSTKKGCDDEISKIQEQLNAAQATITKLKEENEKVTIENESLKNDSESMSNELVSCKDQNNALMEENKIHQQKLAKLSQKTKSQRTLKADIKKKPVKKSQKSSKKKSKKTKRKTCRCN